MNFLQETESTIYVFAVIKVRLRLKTNNETSMELGEDRKLTLEYMNWQK